MRLNRRAFLGLTAATLACASTAVAAVAWRPITINEVDVPWTGLPPALDGLRLGVMADFHQGDHVSPDFIAHAADVMNSLQPDALLLPGDFIQNHERQATACAKALAHLRAPLGILASPGNHDRWVDLGRIAKILGRAGIDLLVNESRTLRHNGASLCVAGLDTATRGEPDPQGALRQAPEDAPTIALIHEPDYADTLAATTARPLPLQVSGHSHGGQVRLPLFGAPVLPPLGRRYPIGLQHVAGTKRLVFTTTGVGDFIPVRLNCPPEVALLTLRRA